MSRLSVDLNDVASAQRRCSSRPRWLRRGAQALSALLVWTMALAAPATALAHQAPLSRLGVRTLSLNEMQHMFGRLLHQLSYSVASGPTYGWEGSVGGTNTGNGNKLTTVPIIGWTQRGGLPVAFTFYHNSEGNHNSELGQKWTFNYDIYLVASGIGPHFNQTIHWGNDLAYPFTNNGLDVFSPPTGIYDTLVKNVDGTFTLTTKNQVAYHFTTAGYCDTISDENGNTVTLAHNSGNYVTSITDSTTRAITLTYDSSNRIQTITDPLSRQWTLTYDSNNQLQKITYPIVTVSGTATTYTATFGYDANHNITSLKSPGGNTSTFSYNSADNSLNWEKDPAGNETQFAYTSGTTCTITDPNSHTHVQTYTSGLLTQDKDALSNHADYLYDTSLNRKQVTDARGKVWQYQFDSNGNLTQVTDPLSDVTKLNWSSHNKLLYKIMPTGEETDYGYDTHDNVTSLKQKDSLGTVQATETYTPNTYGLTTDYYDANSHHYQYGYDGNGCLNSLKTPLLNQTQWTYNGLGFKTTRVDALSRTTTYTRDAWERLVTTTYPDSSTKTFVFDGDSNLTSFTDSSGTTSRTYDADNRLLSESKGGSTIVSHTYDATGKLGLLSTTTDANGRVLTYSYTTRNQLYQVSETAGTTTYSYSANGAETGITNSNGTTVTKGYDDTSQLTSVVNKNSSGTTLSSFSYVLDTDGRRHTCTEADGSVVTYGYDWGSRLTSEVRTGTNAYSYSYTLDAVGNRESTTLGTEVTNFTIDADDELNSTSSTTGGFNNSYIYNSNGQQTGRTLGGIAYTLAFDYDGQLTSLTQGSNVTSFTYDAVGRRLSRTSGSTTTSFLYNGGRILLEKQGSTTTATYTYGNGLIRKDGETPLFDGHGSERTVTNSSQTVTGTATYEGFGQTIATTGSSSDPYMFAATSEYRNDGDAGLMHVGARYYDAQVGQFITRDTLLNQSPYLYCGHDPISAVDPSGHQSVWDRMPTWGDITSFTNTGASWIPGGLNGFSSWGPAREVTAEAFNSLTLLRPSSPLIPSPGQLLLPSQPSPSITPPSQLLIPDPEPPAEGGGAVEGPSPISGAGGGCFAAGTLVALANGGAKPIEDIKIGDLVLSRNDQTGEMMGQAVEKVFVHNTHDRLIVHLSNNEPIETTSNHRFYVVGTGWLHAAQLRRGMHCITDTGAGERIESIDFPIQQTHPVYNLRVHQFHTYFVGRAHIWVHNIMEPGGWSFPIYSAE